MKDLDFERAVTLQLSNDIFYYLKFGEDPLYTDDLSEADRIREQFPEGFEILDEWDAIEGTDLIEAIFVPYSNEQPQGQLEGWDFDMYCDLFNGWQVQIKLLEGVDVELKIIKTGCAPIREGIYQIETNKWGGKQIKIGDLSTGKGCLFNLKHFIKK